MTNEEIEQRAADRFPYMSNDIPERVRTLSLRQAYISGYQQASGEGERKWVELKEDSLPQMLAVDLFRGGTPVWVFDGKEVGMSTVGDHNVWYYEMKEQGITHWMKFELPQPPKTKL